MKPEDGGQPLTSGIVGWSPFGGGAGLSHRTLFPQGFRSPSAPTIPISQGR